MYCDVFDFECVNKFTNHADLYFSCTNTIK